MTATNPLKLAANLSLPLNAATQTFAIGYSPDVDYIAEQVQGGSTFESALARSLQRRPQYRSHESSEQLKKVEGEVR